MEMYIERGESRKDCELKIAEKYKQPFTIYSTKPAKIGGILGLFGKDGVEVEFYFNPVLPSAFNRTLQSGTSSSSYPISAPLQPRPVINELPPRNSPEDLEEAKKKVIAAAGIDLKQVLEKKENSEKQQQLQQQQQKQQEQILELLQEVNEKLDTGVKNDDHPSLVQAERLLKLNDFSEKYTKKMLERLRKEVPFETLDNFDAVQELLIQWIGESISIYEEKSKSRSGRIMVLVGPTGVGKTTTIAKLAALYGVKIHEKPAVSVRMITIDQYRIGAIEQLESFGKIMEIPVYCAKNRQDLKKEIAAYSEVTDLFLVDTFGKGPKDAVMLGEMKELLEGCPKSAEVHLVLSANIKASDIEEILRQFEPFNYLSVLLTKWDETNSIGNVISALAEKGKPVSFITDGQKVPQNIKRATVQRFLLNLGDFKIDREKLEKRFPAGQGEQFQWS